jgi:hypothetical protein
VLDGSCVLRMQLRETILSEQTRFPYTSLQSRCTAHFKENSLRIGEANVWIRNSRHHIDYLLGSLALKKSLSEHKVGSAAEWSILTMQCSRLILDRCPISAPLVTFCFAATYYFAPDRKRRRWHCIWPPREFRATTLSGVIVANTDA